MKSRINRRLVSKKRHTLGYIISGGERITREQAVAMANNGQLSGVRVVNGPSSSYIQSTTQRSLRELPITIESNR